jgi:hypothetical protein
VQSLLRCQLPCKYLVVIVYHLHSQPTSNWNHTPTTKQSAAMVNRTPTVQSVEWKFSYLLGHSWGRQSGGRTAKKLPRDGSRVLMPYVGSECEMCDSPESTLCVRLEVAAGISLCTAVWRWKRIKSQKLFHVRNEQAWNLTLWLRVFHENINKHTTFKESKRFTVVLKKYTTGCYQETPGPNLHVHKTFLKNSILNYHPSIYVMSHEWSSRWMISDWSFLSVSYFVQQVLIIYVTQTSTFLF